MNDDLKSIMDGIIDEDFQEIPEYAFTVNDFIRRLEEKGLPVPANTTVRRRLQKRVKEGKLIFVKHSSISTYYVPVQFAKNAQLDVESIMNS